MNKILTRFYHRRRRKALLLYIDGELLPAEKAEMRQHLENCAACEQVLAEMRAFRALLQAGSIAPLPPTNAMWYRLVRTTAAQKKIKAFRVENPLRSWYWAAAAAMVLVAGTLVWQRYGAGTRASQAEHAQLAAVIDYGIFFDALRSETAPSSFYQRYPAQVMQLAEAQQTVNFPLAAVTALLDSFQLDCVRVLECNGVKCIQLTCRKNGKIVNIFQHELGQAWTLGQYPVARAPICNVACLLVNAKELTAVSWQGSASEFLAVGQLPPQDFAQIVQTLR